MRLYKVLITKHVGHSTKTGQFRIYVPARSKSEARERARKLFSRAPGVAYFTGRVTRER